MTPEEFIAKIEWEGGVLDALEYGLRAEDLDDSDPELKGAWSDLRNDWVNFEPALRNVEEMVEERGEWD